MCVARFRFQKSEKGEGLAPKGLGFEFSWGWMLQIAQKLLRAFGRAFLAQNWRTRALGQHHNPSTSSHPPFMGVVPAVRAAEGEKGG